MRLRLTRLNADDVGAKLVEFRQYKAMQPFADGGEQNHRRNTDGDAQASQKTAYAVGQQAGGGETDQVGE